MKDNKQPKNRILAIETSSRAGSIALGQGEELLAAESFEGNQRHTAELLPAIERSMRRLGWQARDLNEVYVSAGPGSFTGLRIGITVAKTLAMACGVKIVAVPSIEVIAANAPGETRHVGVVLDAKRKQVFAGRFERQEGRLLTKLQACLTEPGKFAQESPKPILLLGEGIRYHREALERQGVSLAEQALWWPKAQAVYQIGWSMARQGEFAEPASLRPIYLRIPEAEEVWAKRHKS